LLERFVSHRPSRRDHDVGTGGEGGDARTHRFSQDSFDAVTHDGGPHPTPCGDADPRRLHDLARSGSHEYDAGSRAPAFADDGGKVARRRQPVASIHAADARVRR
jgi:hypothetical protein